MHHLILLLSLFDLVVFWLLPSSERLKPGDIVYAREFKGLVLRVLLTGLSEVQP